MKIFADRKRQEREFQVGDLVYLKLQPFRQNSVSLRRNLKLSARYYGPYKVLARLDTVAYKLDLPEGARVHPVFHVSLLKRCIGKKHIPVSQLPEVDGEGYFKIAPVAILDSRRVTRKGVEISQILVQWLNAGSHAATWEDLKYIRGKFPSFDPWGQGSTDPGGIVMNRGELQKKIGAVDNGEEEEIGKVKEVVKKASSIVNGLSG